jgi:hypothetical protein
MTKSKFWIIKNRLLLNEIFIVLIDWWTCVDLFGVKAMLKLKNIYQSFGQNERTNIL